MNRVLVGAAMALLAAAGPAAAQEPTIDWAHTAVAGGAALPGEGPGGKTALRLEATTSEASSFHLATIDHPSVTAPGYVIFGKVRYEGVEGQGYLEMWSVFPNGQRFFSRTLATGGPLGALHGKSRWREFALPFHLTDSVDVPTSLEVNLVLPGRGTVWLGPLRLGRSPSGPLGEADEWWSERSGALGGAILGSLLGLTGALIGILSGMGRGRAFVFSLLMVMVGVGGVLAVAGAVAALTSQPRYVWYPLLMIGGLSAVIGAVVGPAVRRRYAADEMGARP